MKRRNRSQAILLGAATAACLPALNLAQPRLRETTPVHAAVPAIGADSSRYREWLSALESGGSLTSEASWSWVAAFIDAPDRPDIVRAELLRRWCLAAPVPVVGDAIGKRLGGWLEGAGAPRSGDGASLAAAVLAAVLERPELARATAGDEPFADLWRMALSGGFRHARPAGLREIERSFLRIDQPPEMRRRVLVGVARTTASHAWPRPALASALDAEGRAEVVAHASRALASTDPATPLPMQALATLAHLNDPAAGGLIDAAAARISSPERAGSKNPAVVSRELVPIERFRWMIAAQSGPGSLLGAAAAPLPDRDPAGSEQIERRVWALGRAAEVGAGAAAVRAAADACRVATVESAVDEGSRLRVTAVLAGLRSRLIEEGILPGGAWPELADAERR